MAALYQDPLRGDRLVISGDSIGMNMVPEEWTHTDAVLLRHVLCLVIVIHNSFHIVLCCRQLKLCRKSVAPPIQMQGLMSPEAFSISKDKEQHAVSLKLFNYVVDTIYSCLDLYLCTLAALWSLTVTWYGYATVVWLNVTFMTLFSTYLVIRRLPSLFYEKLVLDPKYNVDPQKTPPLVGLMCTLALLVVFLQIGIVPITAIFVSCAEVNIWYFVLFIWLLVLVVSLLVHLVSGVFGVPCLGKSRLLTRAEMTDYLREVLDAFKFRGHVYMVHTFYVGRPAAWVMGVCCCLRLDIHDNLMLNRNLATDNLPSTHVGAGLNDEQLAAFVAHQLAHWRLWHVTKTIHLIHVSILLYLIFFGFSYNWQTLYAAAGFTVFYPYVVGYWLVYKYLMPVIHTINIWIVFYFLRHFEYAADAYVWRKGFGGPMKAAIMKLFADDCVFPHVDHGYLMWHHHRPSCVQRIRHLQKLEKIEPASRLSLV